jgi:MoaA/NifB/PqqE/SkfB family radical SAM enzyme
MFWVYTFWWNHKASAFLLNKALPKLGIDLFPPFLEIEHTTVCNFKCKICEHTYWKEPSRNMKFEEFKKIFDQFGRPKWIGLTGIGSSYLNPDFHKIVAYCKSKGTIVELMDHFANIQDEKQIKELLEISPDFQFISIYGATKKTSDSICIGSDFDRVTKNVKTLVRLKKEMKKKFPILNFHYIVTNKSKEEVFGFLEFIHSLDTEIGEVLVTPILHDFKEAKGYSVKLDSDYIDKIRERAKKYDIPITINLTALQEEKGLLKRPPFNYCKEYIMPFVFVTGDLSPCCGINEANERELLKSNSPGNLFHDNIRKIWYSPKYKKIRQLIRQGKRPKECALCPAYQEQ